MENSGAVFSAIERVRKILGKEYVNFYKNYCNLHNRLCIITIIGEEFVLGQEEGCEEL